MTFSGAKNVLNVTKVFMPTSKYRYLFIIGSTVFGIFVIVSADVISRITIANESFGYAFSQCLHYLKVQPVGTLFLLFPFALVGSIAVAFCKIKDGNVKRGWYLSVCCLFPISVLYFIGYHGAQTALQEKAWTAGALTLGFLPFISMPVIGIGTLVCIIVLSIIEGK